MKARGWVKLKLAQTKELYVVRSRKSRAGKKKKSKSSSSHKRSNSPIV